MPEAANGLLGVESLVTGYGKKRVLGGVSLDVALGEIVALIGHNGAGKSTLLKAVFGLLPVWEGRFVLDGQSLNSAKPRELLRMGVAYVPQGNRVFGDLTVRENLEMGGITLDDKQHVEEGFERALTLFPALRSRLGQRAGTLSGGEKQMVALANALIVMPRLLLLDEPSLGLAPLLVTEALSRLRQINRDLRISMLVVEQKVRDILRIAGRVYVLRNGVISYSGPTAPLLEDSAKLREVYL